MQFIARVTGFRIATTEYFESSGQRGACISYEPAMATKHILHVTSAFKELHQHVSSDLSQVLQLVDCSWKMASGMEEIERVLGARPGRQRRQREVLVFLTEAEKDVEDRWASNLSSPTSPDFAACAEQTTSRFLCGSSSK